MTASDFVAFYPQFQSYLSSPVLAEYVRQSNARFGSFGEDAEEARRLFTAHKLTRYLMTVPPAAASGASAETLAESGSSRLISGKRVGEVSVAYASGTSSSVSGALRDLQETAYGAQLLGLLRLYGGTVYVP